MHLNHPTCRERPARSTLIRNPRQRTATGLFEPLEPRRLLAAFEFFAERVVVEAEEFDANTPRGAHAWQPVAGGEGTVGGAMQAMPPNQLTIDSNIASTSPRLDYQINFPEAGEYIIWVRGKGVAGSVPTSDSLHVGLNGVVPATADRVTSFGADWTWSSDTMDLSGSGFEARFAVPSAGVHTVNLYMREDGLAIDRFFISASASGLRPMFDSPGPRASERPTGGTTGDPATVTGSLANPDPLVGPAEVAFDGRNHQIAGVEHFPVGSIAPLPDGRFYLFGRSTQTEAGGPTTRYVTRHFADGSLDTSFADSGRRVLEVESPLVRGPAFPQAGGGFIVWNQESGSPNLLYRYDADLQQDTSFGGDGVISAADEFAIAPNGDIVTILLLQEEQAQWRRYDAAGNVELQVDGAAPHVGAAPPPSNVQDGYYGTVFTLFDSLEVLSDGSVLVVIQHFDYHGLRKFNADFTPNMTYAGDGVADLDMYDIDSRHEFIEAGPDGSVIVSERDVDGEHYATLVAPDGTTTANDTFYWANGLWPLTSYANNQTARFHGDGDVSLAYTIFSDNNQGPPEHHHYGFGVDRFNPDGTRDSSFESFDFTAPQFGDETLRGVDTGLLADGTFIVAANAGSDALLWRISTGEDAQKTVVVDFESAAVGQIASGLYTEDGFTFSNRPGAGGTGLQPLIVHGGGQGYASKVLSTTNWARRIDIQKDGGGTFDLSSFDYAAGRWGEAGDFTVTGTFAAGGTASRNASFSGKQLSTLDLDWTGLELVSINFSGGVNSAYGAVDNFVFGSDVVGGGGTAQTSGSLADPDPVAGPVRLSFDDRSWHEADRLLPRSDGDFYVIGRSGEESWNDILPKPPYLERTPPDEQAVFITQHNPDGSIDRSFGVEGRARLSEFPQLTQGDFFFSPAGGYFHIQDGILTRYTDDLVVDASWGTDGSRPLADIYTDFEPLDDGGYVLRSDWRFRWFDADGNQVPSGDPGFYYDAYDFIHSGAVGGGPVSMAADAANRIYLAWDDFRTDPQSGSLRHFLHVYRITEWGQDTTYADNGLASYRDSDITPSQLNVEDVFAANDGRVVIEVRDNDGDLHAALLSPAGNYLDIPDIYPSDEMSSIQDRGDIHAAAFPDNGGFGVAFTAVTSELEDVQRSGGGGHAAGVHAFDSSGQPNLAVGPFGFADAGNAANHAIATADEQQLILAGFDEDVFRNSDDWITDVDHYAALVRIDPGYGAVATVTVDFESAAVGQIASGLYTENGFTFSNRPGSGGSTLQPLIVHGPAQGYASKVLSTTNWARRIDVTRDGGGTFGLASFDYAAGRWGEAGDFLLTGFLAGGGTLTRTVAFNSKTLTTLELDWQNLTSLSINYSGGVNSAYGAVDNFVFSV